MTKGPRAAITSWIAALWPPLLYTLWHTTNAINLFSVAKIADIGTFAYKVKLFVVI